MLFLVRPFERALCCLAFHTFPLFSFQGAAKDTFSCTLKIEQCKNGSICFLRRSDLGNYTELVVL